MDDAARVQRRERGQHVETNRDRLGRAQCPAPQSLREDLSLEQLHGDEQLAVVFTDLVDLADVWMIDAGCRPGLTPEPLARGRVVGEHRKRLQRDRALQALVTGGVDDTHSASAKLALDRVSADPAGHHLAGGRFRHVRRCWLRSDRAGQPPIAGAKRSAW